MAYGKFMGLAAALMIGQPVLGREGVNDGEEITGSIDTIPASLDQDGATPPSRGINAFSLDLYRRNATRRREPFHLASQRLARGGSSGDRRWRHSRHQRSSKAATTAVFFRADKPFLFLLRDRRSGLILFMGRYVTPAAGG